ncbi:MAG: hypothetical protein MJ208_01505 [Bacilli bacterium]|nr:hypothetical protein [Bacilli bacterium]
MLDFLKRFGLGIVYVLISPFVLVFLACWAIFNLGIFAYELIQALGSFFKGKKFFAEFPEDIEAKRILSLEPYNNDPNQTAPVINQTPTNPTVNNQENKPL